MKKLLLVMAFMLLASTSFAAPFLVCDPQEGVVGYEITGLNPETVNFIAQPDGSLKYDLAPLPNGSYGGTIAACNMWGCSAATAADPFTKAVPSAPAGLRIVAD